MEDVGVIAYLGLGSSLDDRMTHLQQALQRLQDVENAVQIKSISPVYESPHLGLTPEDALRYPQHLNCVVQIVVTLTSQELLTAIQTVEAAGGRQRHVRWGPRTIDIDILLYGESCVQSDTLQIPHPRLAERAFVVRPLFDIAPELRLPDGREVAELAASEIIVSQPLELFGESLRLPE